jgi:xylulokinase
MIFLGVDCGTQSTKTLALDMETGAVLATAQRAYGMLPVSTPGAMEQDPGDWRVAADETIREVISALGSRKDEIRGIGVSGQQHGLVVLDAAGKVVRPAKLWNDTSTTAQCEEIHRHFGGAELVIELAGNPMLPGYTAPKILWLRQNEPENWQRTASVLLPHDYLNFWLTGEKRMEFGDASGTALLNVRSRSWCGPLVSFVADDLAEKLPPLGPSCEPVGNVRDDLLRQWGLTHPVLVSAGGGDNMMSAIGTGNTAPGVVTASLGTSGTLCAFSAKPIVDPAGEVAAFCDSTDHWLPLVCTMNVTLVTEAARHLFDWSHEKCDEAVRSVAPGSDGLLLLPYLSGERTPNLPHGCGVLHGMTTANFTAPHLVRAAMEGVTLGLGYGLRRLRELGVAPAEIRLTGGGSLSPCWRQICADIFGVPVVGLASGEGGGLGAALQAAWQYGREGSMDDLVSRLVKCDEDTRAMPDAENTPVYGELLERVERIRKALF